VIISLGQRGALGIRRAEARGQLGTEDSDLSAKVLVLQQQILIYEPGDVRPAGAQACPVVIPLHTESPFCHVCVAKLLNDGGAAVATYTAAPAEWWSG
jgi:hypothetical protein